MLEGNEEFNFDEVSFKPLTKGLGFHKKEAQKASIGNIVNTGNTQPAPQPLPNKFKGHQVLPSKGQESLGTFYGHSNGWQNPFEDTATQEEVEPQADDSREYCEAPSFEKLFSFLVDLSLIMGLTFITFLSFFYFSPLKAGDVINFLSSLNFLKFFLVLFSIYYITYFSFLDLGRSPGKLLFNLKLVDLNGGQLSFKHTFLRSIISLISFLVAFLPLIVDFHGKLSDSKLVKNEQKAH